MAKVAFIGLGVMGFPMAGHLTQANQVTVYNRTAARAEAWVAKYGHARAATPAAAVAGADIAFICVGDDPDLRQVVTGPDGVLAGLARGAVIVDHTTASAKIARELAALSAEKGIGFVDAPVSGGQAGAENGQLSIMCGGAPDVFAKAEPVMTVYAKMCRLIGPTGSGQLTKMVNQICIAGILQGLAEGINFGQRSGLDMEAVISVIAKGAAQSWQLENRGPTMLKGKYDFGFAVDWVRKDLRIAMEEAQQIGAALPIVAQVDKYYGEVQAQGHGRWDTSALLSLLKDA